MVNVIGTQLIFSGGKQLGFTWTSSGHQVPDIYQPTWSSYGKLKTYFSGGGPKIEGLTYKPTSGVNRCLFQALAESANSSSDALLDQAKKIVYESLAYYRDYFSELKIPMSPEQYIDELQVGEEGSWLDDDLEINILMDIFKRPICVIEPDGKLRRSIDLGPYLEKSSFYIFYNGYDHYDAYVLNVGWRAKESELIKRLISRTYSAEIIKYSSISQALISGITGSGKTTLARVYIKYFLEEDPCNRFVYLLDVENEEKFQKSLVSLAGSLTNPVEFNAIYDSLPAEQKAILVEFTIKQGLIKRSWTLVLDSVEHESLNNTKMQNFLSILKECGQGKIIYTSQHDNLTAGLFGFDLSFGMDPDSAINLVKQYLNDFSVETLNCLGDEGQWRLLVEDVNRLPLALVLAGKYLFEENKSRIKFGRKPDITIASYRAILSEVLRERIDKRDRKIELKKLQLLRTQHAAVYMSIKKSIKTALLTSGEENLKVLLRVFCFFGFLSGNCIPQILFDRLVRMTSSLVDAVPFIAALSKYSLLQLECRKSCIDKINFIHMHKCVQDVLRNEIWDMFLENLCDGLLDKKVEMMKKERLDQIKALSDLFVYRQKDRDSYRHCLELKDHADQLLKWFEEEVGDDPAVESLRIKLAYFVCYEGWRYHQVIQYLRNWKDGKEEPKVSIEEKITAYTLLAEAYIYLDLHKAEEMAAKALNYLNESLIMVTEEGRKKNETWVALQLVLGVIYTEQHQFDKAESFLKIVIECGFQVPCIEALRMMGRIKYRKNEWKQSRELLLKALALHDELYHEFPSMEKASLLFDLGVLDRLEGKYKEAEINLQVSLKIQKSIHGEGVNHLSLVHTLNEIGNLYYFQGDFCEAQTNYNLSLCILDGLEKEMDEKDGIKLIDDKDVESRFITLNQYISYNLYGLSQIFMASSNMIEAKNYLVKALYLQRQVYRCYRGDDKGDIDIVATLIALGKLLINEKLNKEAGENLKEALNMQYCLYGEGYVHSNLALTIALLGHLEFLSGDSGSDLLASALEMQKKIYGKDDHPDVVEIKDLLERCSSASIKLI